MWVSFLVFFSFPCIPQYLPPILILHLWVPQNMKWLCCESCSCPLCCWWMDLQTRAVSLKKDSILFLVSSEISFVCLIAGKVGTQVIIPYRSDPYVVGRLKLCGDLGQILFTVSLFKHVLFFKIYCIMANFLIFFKVIIGTRK